MLRRGENKYIVMGDTAAGLWLLLIEFNFRLQRVHLFYGWDLDIGGDFMQLGGTVCSCLVGAYGSFYVVGGGHVAHIDGCALVLSNGLCWDFSR